MVPFDLLADRLRRSYLRRRVCIERDDFIAPKAMSHIRDEETERSVAKWRKRLEELSRNASKAAVQEKDGISDLPALCSGDNAVHTFLHCPSWVVERGNLFVALGLDLDLDREYNLVEAIMCSSETWTSFANFYEAVMRRKEETERDRERDRRVMERPLAPLILSQDSASS
ncbi:PREDICTED: uncharacterized protein LOC105151187 [Acromyrmex echinatior]|uniref:uncharacterized protein LOC105151187 n=1 Tax=Acromyrmex echinatior TaxID=103372 RepID=UPI000580EBE6|nr:PREDICTED: uncharacterized protein LOC105151187 [Acromyrmex echinatior]